jgi:AhpC/TSA family
MAAMLRTREIIPPLTLHALDGRTVRAWDFKQKKNLVIVFLHAGCAECEEFLRQMAADRAAWKNSSAVVLVAVMHAPSRALADAMPENVIVGIDASGRGADAYLGRDTLAPAGEGRLGVFVTDRYGELQAQWEVGAMHDFPVIETIGAKLELIEMACDECSTPAWKPED